jgi:hypothetical protein
VPAAKRKLKLIKHAEDHRRSFRFLSKQIRAAWRELHECPGFVQPQPAALNREIEAGFVLGRLAPSSNSIGPLIFSMWIRPSCRAKLAGLDANGFDIVTPPSTSMHTAGTPAKRR